MRDFQKRLDDLDRRIISEFQKDGRKSSKDLARKLGVSDGTIRFRTKKLMKQKILRITASIDPFCFSGEGLLVYVGMALEKRTHTVTMKKISDLKGVVSVCNVSGRYDLLVEIFLESRQDLNRFLIDSLSSIGGINRTETFIVLDAINKWVEIP